MFQCSRYRVFLFFRTARLLGIWGFRLIIILTFDDPVLSFYLGDIQVCHMETVLLLHPILDLLICSPLLETGHIHVFEREFNSDILTQYGLRSASVGAKRTSTGRPAPLGKLNNRLDCCFVEQPNCPTLFTIIIYRELEVDLIYDALVTPSASSTYK